jgi:hypothetical protein
MSLAMTAGLGLGGNESYPDLFGKKCRSWRIRSFLSVAAW